MNSIDRHSSGTPVTSLNPAGLRRRRYMYGRAYLTPAYSIEITLYDYEGVYVTSVVWDPEVPGPDELKELEPLVEEALAPYHLRVLQQAGLIGRHT